MLEKVVFSSADLPRHLGERARFNLWRDLHSAQIAATDFSKSADLPFEATFDGMAVGPLVLSQMSGTLTEARRTAARIATDGNDGYCFFINIGNTDMAGTQLRRDYTMVPGGAALVAMGDPGVIIGRDSNRWFNLMLPNRLLTATFDGIEDRAARSIRSDNAALNLLRRYCRMLETGPLLETPSLATHATETIIDLVGLATGAKGEAAELATGRGLRAARRLAILARIGAGFTDPEISAQAIAQELGLSVRYVHQLLYETGTSFAERVLELRLQKTASMLADRRHDHMLISDIALAAGFSDISYFNRSFRRRFGCTPGSMR